MNESEITLAGLLERGGIQYSLPGKNVQEVLGELIKKIPSPKEVLPQDLLKAVMEREKLMPTGIGGGIALPHPRNPVTSDENEQYVSIAFLKEPVDWKALDGKPVDTLMLLISASAKLHLQTLSVLTYFCQQDEFIGLLNERASKETIIAYIKDTEQKWRNDEHKST